jgi:hypothetical protein
MATKIQLRRDTAANWASANPVLSAGEPALETDTNKVKYGDGATTWSGLQYSGDAFTSSGAANKPVGMREVSGVKSFTFRTTGHRYVSFTASSGLNGSSTIQVDATQYPNITGSLEAFNNGSNIYYYVNDVQQNDIINVTVSGNTYTLWVDGTVTCNSTSQILISAWSRGTQAVFPDYISSDTHYPSTNSANNNTVRVDLTAAVFGSSYDYHYHYNGVYYNLTESLTNFPGKNYIVFNPGGFLQYRTQDQRKITHAVNVTGNIWDLTFDGAPRSAGTENVTLPVQAAFSATDSHLYINAKNYPQLINFVPFGQADVKVNGTVVATFHSFTPTDNQNYSMDQHGNWKIPLNTSITYAISDTIELDFTTSDFFRVDYFVPNLNDSSNHYNNNAYRWFDWNTDVPHSVNQRGNGVQGGMIQGYISVYDTETQATERTLFNNFFKIQNDNTWNYPMVAMEEPYGDQMYGQFLTNSGHFGDNNYIYWDFYEAGIFFSKTPSNENTWYIARDIKVDIAYKMTVFIDSTEDNWC